MVKQEYIASGSRFLPGYGTSQLRGMGRGERDPKASQRLLAFIKRNGGISIRDICAGTDMPYGTVRGWPLRAMQVGISGRYPFRPTGAPCKLGPERPAVCRQCPMSRVKEGEGKTWGEFGGDITMECILPYTEPSPVGVQWQMIKKGMSSTLHEALGDMKRPVRKMMRNGETGTAKMSEYLTA